MGLRCPLLQMPLGKLKKETILKGYQVLQHISKLVAGASSGGVAGASSGGASGGVAGSHASILELSNSFYSLIPHVSYDEHGGTRGK